MNAQAIIVLAIKLSIFLNVLGFGLNATMDDALYLFRNPGHLMRSLLAMNVIMPLLVIMLVLFFDLHPIVKVTILALSVSPVPPIMPMKTAKAGGTEYYVISLLFAAALFSIVLIPAWLKIFEWIADKPVQISTGKIILTVLTSTIVPLILGILIHHFSPAFAEKVKKPVSKTGIILLIISILPLLFVVFPTFRTLISNGTILVIIAFVILGIVVGHFLGGPIKENRTVLALCTATRHPGIAMALASVNTPDPKLVPAVLVLYLLVSAIVALPYMKWLRGKQSEIQV